MAAAKKPQAKYVPGPKPEAKQTPAKKAGPGPWGTGTTGTTAAFTPAAPKPAEKKPAAKKKNEADLQTEREKQQAKEPKVTKKQIEALGAGREEAYDREDKKPVEVDKSPGFDSEDSPSALALAKVGALDGEKVKPADVEDALAHGEAYQLEKKRHRWG